MTTSAIGLRAGIPRIIIVIPGFVLATCGAVDADAGMGSAEDIDGRILFRLGRCGARGMLLLLAVGAAGTCALLSSGWTNWTRQERPRVDQWTNKRGSAKGAPKRHLIQVDKFPCPGDTSTHSGLDTTAMCQSVHYSPNHAQHVTS
jgi:hypothetical protein